MNVMDFAVDKPTFIQTLETKYPLVENILQIFDSRICFRGIKGKVWLQKNKSFTK